MLCESEPAAIQSQKLRKLIAGLVLAVLADLSAGDEPLQAEPDLSPPPVPAFMLRKPDKPLPIEEMRRQADEAAARVRVGSESSPPQPSSEGGAQEEVNIHKP